jgi:hypothetical protein
MYDVLVTVDDDEERGLAQADALLDLPVDPREMRVRCYTSSARTPRVRRRRRSAPSMGVRRRDRCV